MTPTQYDLKSAYAYCRHLALGHYENFPVASILLPKRLRPHVFAAYAFMRTADDFADLRIRPKADRLALLADWRRQLIEASETTLPIKNPVFIALRETLKQTQLPVTLFHNLIDAFEFDAQDNVRFDSLKDLRWYTARSAEPVGRIMLHLFGYESARLAGLSDDICTALQLINFIQDAGDDLRDGRLYIPLELCARFGFENPSRILADNGETSRQLLREFTTIASEILIAGSPLCDELTGRFRMEIRAVVLGAHMMLRKIEMLADSTIRHRPVLTRHEHRAILFGAVFGAKLHPASPGPIGKSLDSE